MKDEIQLIRTIVGEFIFKFLGKFAVIPYMKYREILIIRDILYRVNPKKCLEWGMGYSTLYFPRFCDENSIWISIEHQDNWYNKIKKLNKKIM